MNRKLLLPTLFLLLVSGNGCRTSRHESEQRIYRVDNEVEQTLRHTVDSLYRHELSGEIEWERVIIDYSPDSLADTFSCKRPTLSVTRWKRAVRLSQQEKRTTTDTLTQQSHQQVYHTLDSYYREKQQNYTSKVIYGIIVILILLLIYKLN